MPALVAEEGAHVDGEVLLVGQRGEEGEPQPVVVRLLVELRGQAVVCAQVVRHAVLRLVVRCRHVLHDLPLPLLARPAVLLVKVRVGFILLLFPEEVKLFIRIQIPAENVVIQLRCSNNHMIVVSVVAYLKGPKAGPGDIAVSTVQYSTSTVVVQTDLCRHTGKSIVGVGVV